jgi:tRNA(Ile)-lysidine synthase
LVVPLSPGERDKTPPAILRPLLGVTRAELLAYLANLGQKFRTDSTNSDLAFTRNRIRAELLPLLRTFNPAVVGVLGRLAVQAEELTEWVADDAAKLLAEAELPRAGGAIILDGDKLRAAGEVRARAAVRFVWHREGWPVNGMTFAHWRRAAAVALGDHPAADFPAGVHVRKAGKVVQLRRRS